MIPRQAGLRPLLNVPSPAVADAAVGLVLSAVTGSPASVVAALEAVPVEQRADALAHALEWAAVGVTRESVGYSPRERPKLRRIDGVTAVTTLRRRIRALRRTGGRP